MAMTCTVIVRVVACAFWARLAAETAVAIEKLLRYQPFLVSISLMSRGWLEDVWRVVASCLLMY
jgi:hypothetical protein